MRTKTAMCVGHVCVGAAEKKKVVKVVNTILGIYFLCYIVRERGLGGLGGEGGPWLSVKLKQAQKIIIYSGLKHVDFMSNIWQKYFF